MDPDNVQQMPGTSQMSDIIHGASKLAEGYQALLVAGFEQDEALYLIASMASGGPKAPPGIGK